MTAAPDLTALVAMLAANRARQHQLKADEAELTRLIAAAAPMGSTPAGDHILTLSPNRRFDEDAALDALARMEESVRTRCVTTTTRESVDRKALEVLAPEVYEAAWRSAAPRVTVKPAGGAS